MNDDGAPVTRAQLRQELARYPTREELKEELRRELARFATREEVGQLVRTVSLEHEKLWHAHETLHRTLDQFMQISARRHEELLREIAGSARAAAEEHRRELGVLDDRYRDLPARVTTLERELDEHRRDGAFHAPPRRPRRQR